MTTGGSVIRRTRWHAAVAALSLLTLLVSVDVCMLVTCAPRAAAKARCAHCATPASDPSAPAPPATGDSAPCCIQGTLAGAPVLAAPAETVADALPALLAEAARPAAPDAPRAARPPDAPPPHTADDAAPRGERAPPIA